MRRKRSSVSRHVSDDGAFLDVHFCRELPGVFEVCGSGRPPWAQQPQPDPGRALPAPERQHLPVPESLLCPHSSGTTGPVCRYRPGPRSAGASLGPGVPHQVLLFHVFRRPYSGGAFLPSRLSGLRRRGRCRAGCRAVAERSGRGGKGQRMCCWSKWPVGQSDPIGYWLVAAAVLEPEPLPTVVITTKGRWRIKGGE
jgi:hypothetical protein